MTRKRYLLEADDHGEAMDYLKAHCKQDYELAEFSEKPLDEVAMDCREISMYDYLNTFEDDTYLWTDEQKRDLINTK